MIGHLLPLIGLVVTTNAHMFIASPAPIDGTAPKNPLLPDGSDFPCHGASLPSSGGQSMAAGSSQQLSWALADGANTAVHGGGSCQISISYETDAGKLKDPKSWYVIYSIESGCPSNTQGNLDGNFPGPNGGAAYTGALACTDPLSNGLDCVNAFNFTIPKGVKTGHAILAWTWFNNVGNREMYMNCVNADITGGDESEMDELPSMFVANAGSINQCPTTAYENVKFPFPGKYVTTKTPEGEAAKIATTTYPIVAPSGAGCESNGAPVGGGASAPPGDGAATTDPAASSSEAPPAASAGGTITVTAYATVTAGADDAAGSSTSAAAAASSDSGASGGTTGSSTCPYGQVSCSSPGAIICIGTSQFGQCDIDNCAVPMALAPGTSCANGTIRKRSMRYVG